MPGVIDKIRLNSGCIAAEDAIYHGNAKAIQIMYDNSKMLCEEIEKGGWLNDPAMKTLLADQVASCTEIESVLQKTHIAQRKHLDAQDTRNETMRAFIDAKLGLTP